MVKPALPPLPILKQSSREELGIGNRNIPGTANVTIQLDVVFSNTGTVSLLEAKETLKLHAYTHT